MKSGFLSVSLRGSGTGVWQHWETKGRYVFLTEKDVNFAFVSHFHIDKFLGGEKSNVIIIYIV